MSENAVNIIYSSCLEVYFTGDCKSIQVANQNQSSEWSRTLWCQSYVVNKFFISGCPEKRGRMLDKVQGQAPSKEPTFSTNDHFFEISRTFNNSSSVGLAMNAITHESVGSISYLNDNIE